jgi:phytoene desaturase
MAKNVIIVGSGIGGITTAILLARKGYHVKIVEKNSYPGGRCGQINRNGHRFDMGATLLMMTDIYEKTYRLFGRNIHEELDLIRMDPVYRIKFKDRDDIMFTSDLKKMQDTLERIEPGSYQHFLDYLNQSYRSYKLSMEHIIDRNYYRATDFFNLKNLVLLFRLNAFKNHFKHSGRYFKNELLRIVFTFQNIYVGQNPFESSAIFSMLPFMELTDGVWYPKGGMSQVVDNLLAIAREENVEIIYNSEVQNISVKNNKADGIKLTDGSFHPADIVVANADLPYVYQKLLPDGNPARKINKLNYTCSAFIFHWGMDKLFPQLEQHNVYVSDDYRKNIHAIFNEKSLPDDPSFYIHAPARTDKSAAPVNQDSISAIVPTGHLVEGREYDWNTIRDKARNSVVDRLSKEGIADFDKHIKFEICYTPGTWESQLNLTKGSVFGSLSHNLLQMGYMRPNNQHAHYKNLFFAGGSTHPGNGIPMVLISAKLTSEKIIRFFPIK